ncbi:MAG: porin family protein [Bacteroidota bacterium]
MRTVCALLIALFLFNNANAQNLYVQGGLNLANITTTNDGNTEKNNQLLSFNAGLMGRFGLSKEIDIETGLLLTGKGSKAETYFNGGNDYIKTTFNPLYLELPLNVVVTIPLQKGTDLFVHGGPYGAIGIAGKSKRKTNFGSVTTSSSSDIQFSDDDPFTSEQENAGYNRLKRFDYGFNIGGGLQFQHLLLKVNYGLGLVKINSTEDNNSANDRNKFRTWSISVGIPLK